MLEHFRSGETAFFSDMTNQHDHWTILFRKPREHRRGFAYLHHTARRAAGMLHGHHLNGVDDDKIRLVRSNEFEQRFDTGFRD